MEYIINADDFGRTHTVNLAITEGFHRNLLSRTTVMVNMPFFDEAVEMANNNGFIDLVGLHINLISGIPLTENIKNCPEFCTDGKFNGQIFKNRKLRIWLPAKTRKAVAEEISAQIDKYKANGFTLLHADSHGHVHTFPSLLGITLRLLRKAGFSSLRLSLNLKAKGIKKILKKGVNRRINAFNSQKYSYCDDLKTVKKSAERLNLKSGRCEIMLHPNIFDGDIMIGQRLHYDDLPESFYGRKIEK